MDRINGADTIDIGGGRRGFRDENLVAGAAGTEVTALFLNMVQEEILKVVTEAGLAPSEGDWTQLWQALQIHGLSADSRSRRWLAVISMTLSSAPGAPSAGDTYLIPTGATGIWATHVGEITQWTGSAWSYLAPPDGHGISLPDGRVFERIAGTYVQKLALDAQSGKWNYAVAGGTANALTAALSPAPSALQDGLKLSLLVASSNTDAATLNLNGNGALPIYRLHSDELLPGDISVGINQLVYVSGKWRLLQAENKRIRLRADTTFYVSTTGNDATGNGTSGKPWATVNKAFSVLAESYDAAGFNITIQLAAGSYGGNTGTFISKAIPGVSAGNPVVILGNVASPGSCGLTNSTGSAIVVTDGVVTVSGVTITSSGGTSAAGVQAATPRATVNIGAGVVFGAVGGAHVLAYYGAFINVLSSYSITGGAQIHYAVATGGVLIATQGITVSLSGAPSFIQQFVQVVAANALLAGINFSGAANGVRYSANTNGTITTAGAGPNYFPGSAAGSTALGGQYV